MWFKYNGIPNMLCFANMQVKLHVSYDISFASEHNNNFVVHLNKGIKRTFTISNKGSYHYSNMRNPATLETRPTF